MGNERAGESSHPRSRQEVLRDLESGMEVPPRIVRQLITEDPLNNFAETSRLVLSRMRERQRVRGELVERIEVKLRQPGHTLTPRKVARLEREFAYLQAAIRWRSGNKLLLPNLF